MKRIAQFGEGNFLRAFADLYFEALNQEDGDFSVSVMKPRKGGSLDAFRANNGRYHVILQGNRGGKCEQTVIPVSVLHEVFSPFEEPERFFALAKDPHLRFILSNTTEAGICFSETDSFEDFDTMTFPARLTRFLFARYEAGEGGLYILPTELVDENGDALHRAVDAYITLWGLPEAFRQYNDTENHYCNTLVDRIVSGYPKNADEERALQALLPVHDPLLTVAEPYGLWCIEKKGEIEHLLPAGQHGTEVLFVEDIKAYKKRKVRVLNGSHTNLVFAGLAMGKETVYDCMQDERLTSLFRGALAEIIPFAGNSTEETTRFAGDVAERFANPYLNHRLMDISLNSISKWRARILPTMKDYCAQNGKVPPHLTLGLSYLIFHYKTHPDRVRDDASLISRFAKPLSEILGDTALWGEDLRLYAGLADAVSRDIAELEQGVLPYER